MATHSSSLTWKIPWMKEPGVLQSMGSQTVGPLCATSLNEFYYFLLSIPPIHFSLGVFSTSPLEALFVSQSKWLCFLLPFLVREWGTGEILRGQWVLLPLAFHLARSRLCPVSIWLLPVDPVVFHLCEINIDHSSESGKSVLMQYTCASVCVCVCVCVCVWMHTQYPVLQNSTQICKPLMLVKLGMLIRRCVFSFWSQFSWPWLQLQF